MFGAIFSFELRYQLRQPLFWIATALLSLLAFMAVTTDIVSIEGSLGNIHRNAPFVTVRLLIAMSVIAVFAATAFVAGCVQRDWERGTYELFFSTSMRTRDYLLGRFTGALVVSALLMVGIAFTIALGGNMPWLEVERVGPFRVLPFLVGFGVFVLPNLAITGCILFSLATMTRSMLHTYVGVLGLFAGYEMAQRLVVDLDNRLVATLLDPFGGTAFEQATRYWTVADKNTMVPGLDMHLVANRVLWLAIAGIILLVTCARFRVSGRGGRRSAGDAAQAVFIPPDETSFVPVTPTAGSLTPWLRQIRFEIASVMRGTPFLIILAIGILNVLGGSSVKDSLYGTPVWPVTHLMLGVIEQSFALFVVLIVTFYCGELTWRDRTGGIAGVVDAMPVKTWVLWSAKLVALCVAIVMLQVVAGLTTIGIQASRGFTDFELPLYGIGLGIQAVSLMFVAVLAFTIQVLVNQKHLGFLLMVVYVVATPALGALGFDHLLYRYPATGEAPYSDLNGYGHFLTKVLWLDLYWLCAAVLLAVVVHLFWNRGSEVSRAMRRRIARGRVTGGVIAAGIMALLGLAATGGYVYYNTNVRNEYLSSKDRDKRQAEFEKLYKVYAEMPHPRITAVWAAVDIFPEERRVAIRGNYTLQNKTEFVIDRLHLQVNPRVKVVQMTVADATLASNDAVHGYAVYKLAPPLAPGAQLKVRFELMAHEDGFVNSGANTDIVGNGTFLSSERYFPHIGYSSEAELRDPNQRRKYGLEPLVRMPPLDDPAGRGRNYLTGEADWIDFETVVSTSADQVAIAPGYLQREWTESSRRYFNYKMDRPILSLFAYQSARYAVRRDRWNDVSIEIYHHPKHTYNLDRMVDAVKKSLDYMTTEVSPYQFRQLRIVEFPGYARFAQSLANTIPFSEGIGFVTSLDDPDDIDYVFYVTAHEVAHQWWAHQVIGANVQGAAVLTETMAQYSALMIMEREYGREKMRRFLQYELERYLKGRGGELLAEQPLLRVEEQPYIYYQKGSLVMYALKDYLGEQPLNTALRDYVQRVRYQQPPYTTSVELLDAIRAVTPEHLQGALGDLFEQITLFDNHTDRAEAERQGDGTYRVKLTVESRKLRADETGVEREVTLDDWIDVGVFGKRTAGEREGKLLALERRHFEHGSTDVELVVGEEPARAGIDPLSKLIDRKPDDNAMNVTIRGSN